MYPLIQLVECGLAESASAAVDWAEAASRLINAVESSSSFISQSGGYPMYRGYSLRDHQETLPVVITAPRADRKPLDTNIGWHNLIDNYFLKKFGHKFRSNALFCTGDKRHAQDYGPAFLVIPHNPMKFLWSPQIDDLANNPEVMRPPPEGVTEIGDDTPAGTYINSNLSGAISSTHEIMIYSPKVALLSAELTPQDIRLLVAEINKSDDVMIPQCNTSEEVLAALIHSIYS